MISLSKFIKHVPSIFFKEMPRRCPLARGYTIQRHFITVSSKPNVKFNINLNQKLNQSKSLEELQNFYNSSALHMNLINFSTLLKKINDFTTAENGIPQKLAEDIPQKILILIKKDLKQADASEVDARVLSNIFYYLNKNPRFEQYRQSFNAEIAKILPHYIPHMNDQELSTTLITLYQNEMDSFVPLIMNEATNKIQKFGIRAFCILIYQTTKNDTESPALYRKAAEYIQSNQSFGNLTAQDYSNVLFSVCKRPELYLNQEVVKKMERTGYLLRDKLNPVGLTSVFHSLCLLQQQIFSDNFYATFEKVILGYLKQMNHISFSNILRGYMIFHKGSPGFLQKFAEEAIVRAESLDLQSFSTVFYYFSKPVNQDVFVKYANVLMNKRVSEFTPNQLQYLLYALSVNIPLVQKLFPGGEVEKSFGGYIKENLEHFSEKELVSIAHSMKKLHFPRDSLIQMLLQIDKRILTEPKARQISSYSVLELNILIFEILLKSDESQLEQEKMITPVIKKVFDLTKQRILAYKDGKERPTEAKGSQERMIIQGIIRFFRNNIESSPQKILPLCDEDFLRLIEEVNQEFQQDSETSESQASLEFIRF